MSKDDDTKFTTPPVVFVLEEQIEKLKVENKKLRKDILMFQARYMELLPINKKLRECVEFYADLQDNYMRTMGLDVRYKASKCLKEIDENE